MKKYKAMSLSCIDPRFQPLVYNYFVKRKLKGKYSSFTIAGAAIGVTNKKFKKWHTTFFENLLTSVKIHKINKLIVINHKDCGAAKIVNGKKKFNDFIETKIHKKSFIQLKKILKKKLPKLKVEFALMSLKKKVENY